MKMKTQYSSHFFFVELQILNIWNYSFINISYIIPTKNESKPAPPLVDVNSPMSDKDCIWWLEELCEPRWQYQSKICCLTKRVAQDATNNLCGHKDKIWQCSDSSQVLLCGYGNLGEIFKVLVARSRKLLLTSWAWN